MPPIGKVQQTRKQHTNEPHASNTTHTLNMDSTIDSRISSTDIPQMELLKVNYVHQCKEAMMHKPGERLNSPARYAAGGAYRRSSGSNLIAQMPNITKITIGGGGGATNMELSPNSARKPLPPIPPPTIESWQLLQNSKQQQRQAPKFVVQQAPLEDSCDSCTNSCCDSACSGSDSDVTETNTVTPDCEKSHSWNYRTKCNTRDVRRDLARAGIKSRADRIARIEKSECEHRTDKQPEVQKLRGTPPQPQRNAPAAAPKKEPNMRSRGGYAQQQQQQQQHKNGQRSGSGSSGDCCDCMCSGASTTSSLDGITTNSPKQSQQPQCYQPPPPPLLRSTTSTDMPSAHVSRIPKPIQQDYGQRNSASTALLFTEANEQLQRRVKQLFQQDVAHAHLQQQQQQPTPPKWMFQNGSNVNVAEAQTKPTPAKVVTEMRHVTPRLSAANYQKVKLERVHIRKKRQPLLIINQLNANEPNNNSNNNNSNSNSSNVTTSASQTLHDEMPSNSNETHADHAAATRRTCGYKNCNFENCPMSAAHQQQQQQQQQKQSQPQLQHLQNKTDKMKRLSLESCSDSGVSSSTDTKEQMKHTNLKNLEKCADCVKVLKSTEPYSNKLKLSPPALAKHKQFAPTKTTLAGAAQIKIHVDPNDVQNFAKKNLTKATTDELLTAAIQSSANKAKQCNIEIEQKYNETQKKLNNFRTTTIKIDDNWIPDKSTANGNPNANEEDDYLDTDSLMLPDKSNRNSSSNNCVKIFVSSATAQEHKMGGTHALPRAPSSNASAMSTVSASSTSTSSSGCGSSSMDSASLCCESEKDCCGFARECSKRGTDLNCLCCRQESICCNAAVGGVFWNNTYFYNEQEPATVNGNEQQQHPQQQCYCSLSSCEDDNCSYYEADFIVETTPQSTTGIATKMTATNSPAAATFEDLQAARRQRQLLRNSSAEDILIRNKKLLKKTDAIHELRPRSMDGVVDSGVSLNGDAGSSPDGSEHMQNQQDTEARRLKRGHVLSELLETERIYVNEMSSILKGYRDQMCSEEMIHLVPASLQGKEDILFGNLHELYTFHNEIFLKDLENCISTTELVALCFVQRRDTFYRLYSFYCQNIPRSERLRETLVDTHLFLQECQKRLGHKLPLAAYLLKPVQRITKYQLLLKDLLRFSDSGSCTKELQKALDCMLIVLKCVNDSMHQVAITGFPTDLAQQGELLLQDSFQVWSESKKDIRLRIKPQQRHIFLYQKSMLFCKQTSKPGHNKSTYQFKHHLKMSQIGLTESVRGDTKRFEVWLQGRQEVHTLQAPTIEIKNKWVAEIKRVLLNQLEELKGEKIKQYGLNHRGLKQTTSWDTPNIILANPQRTISCDASSESSNRNSNCSSDDNVPITATATSGSNQHAGDKEQQEACGWSSDYSNSEDELSLIEDNSTPGSKFIALADYTAMGHSEVSMREGETIELLKVGCAGWWYVRVLDSNAEGWTPAAYLESINRKSSRSSSRNQERINLK